MLPEIPTVQAWLKTARGQALRAAEAQLLGEALQDVFGWELVQVGRWGEPHELIQRGRTRRQLEVVAPGTTPPGDVQARLGHLPFASDSIDAVVLPHTLEFEADPHGLLREVDRVLTGEGQLLVLGFRPFSLWGVARRRGARGLSAGLAPDVVGASHSRLARIAWLRRRTGASLPSRLALGPTALA